MDRWWNSIPSCVYKYLHEEWLDNFSWLSFWWNIWVIMNFHESFFFHALHRFVITQTVCINDLLKTKPIFSYLNIYFLRFIMARSSNFPMKLTFQEPQSSSVYVGNLPYTATEDAIRTFFHENGATAEKFSLMYDRETNQSRGFGFLQFRTLDSYKTALDLDGIRFQGRELKISPSQSNSSVPRNNRTTSSTSKTDARSSGTFTKVVHCKKSPYDVYIGRPSNWGNPFVIGKDGDRADVISKYRQWIMQQPDLLARAKNELRGRTIACWCKPEACHGDVLAAIADADDWFHHHLPLLNESIEVFDRAQ